VPDSRACVADGCGFNERSERPPQSPPKCPPGHPHLIAADAQAQVYVGSGYGGTVYRGCAYGHRGSYVVGGPPGGSAEAAAATRHLVLAGPMVAGEEFVGIASIPPGESEKKWTVVVTDLRNGRVLHEVPTGIPSPPNPRLVGNGDTTAIVVKSDGAVAWIVELANEAQPPEYQVHTLDRSGSRVLASGAGIGPASLALGGSTLYWTQGGKPFSTPLN